ncbi:MAG: hypothetical protein ACPGXX_00620 [Planctomycetaceae bacterium]
MSSEEIRTHERRNLLVLLINQSLFRMAWIFKTESVIIPAFLDTISGSGALRGLLPLLNRLGQSIAPLLMAPGLRATPVKSIWLGRTTFLMGIPFLFFGASVKISGADLPESFAIVFLLAYVVFFGLHGVNEMSAGTVLGKLIPPARRGRLQAAAAILGTGCAVTTALLLLRPWLNAEGQRPFGNIFLFVGSMMMLASVVTRFLREPADVTGGGRRFLSLRETFAGVGSNLRGDRIFRQLCIMAVLFVFSQSLFPHFQRVGLETAGESLSVLLVWVIAQHIGAVCFSTITGLLADRAGVRAALRLLLPCAAVAPLLAVSLAHWFPQYYWLTFFWIGLVPVTFRMQVNYALEIAPAEKHPEYISTLNLCMTVPFLLSPMIGYGVERIGYLIPFVGVALIVSAGAVTTLFLPEPRHEIAQPDGADSATI